MKRLTRATPWLFVAVAVAFIVSFAAGTALPDPWWRYTIIACWGLLVLFGWRVNQMPRAFMVVMTLAAARLVTLPTGGSGSPTSDLSWLPLALDAAVGVVLCILLAVFARRRHGEMCRRDFIDVLAITIGASILTWLLVTNPLIDDQGVSVELAILASLYLPLSSLILTFTVDLLFTGLEHHRTMQFVVGAAFANLIAAGIKDLWLVEVTPAGGQALSVCMYSIAFLLMCAGLSHSDGTKTVRTEPGTQGEGHDSTARLTLLTLGLVIPVASIALVAPTTGLDEAVRTVSTLALMGSLVVRLAIALRDHAAARDSLLRKVNRDDLTGLPTRTRFVEDVSDLLETTWRSERQPTIIQLNLDRFKHINDSLGHFDANRVLVEVAGRLTCAAASFGGTVARSGGDDFVIVDGTSSSTTDALLHVEEIRNALAAPIEVGESTVFVTASIGVAVAPRHRTVTAEDLMRRADIANHRAKGEGRNRVALFDDSMHAQLTRRMDVEQALHGAIGRQEMCLYHQPIVDIVTGRVSGFEALIRWQRSDGTLVSPGDFIPIAEETGIICELGAWALHDALRELRGWIDTGVVAPTTTISVNVSPRQIADPNFAEVVHDALERSGVSPHLLWIEMTESMMLEEPELAQSTLRQVRSMGVRLALDDFGTGFSSLSLLQNFPIQRIKIDRAFVRGIAEHGNDRSLVRTIIAMAQSMGLDLVAEGVETVHQLQGLRDMGCDKAQGYLISHPVPAAAMRSTMVALDELQSLSLFGSIDAAPEPIVETAGVVPSIAEPVGHAIGGPIGNMGNRPLGQPML